MDRRESLKLLLLGAVGSHRIMRPFEATAQDNAFASTWDQWPDVRWAGPEYWGNRLQDWEIRGGALVCRTKAPNRTLHCLTHRAIGPEFETSVTVHPEQLDRETDFAGFRIGLKGRFDDYRSAAVHGAGLDVGVDGQGRVFIGDQRSSIQVPMTEPIRLRLNATRDGLRANVELQATSLDGDGWAAGVDRNGIPFEDLIGNLALVNHFEGGGGTAVRFTDWTIGGPGITADPGAAFGPIMFAQYTVHRGILKLTAQLAPVEDIEDLRAHFDVRRGAGNWSTVADAPVDPLARTARFRIESWDSSSAAEYRVRISLPMADGPRQYTYTGTIAAEPPTATPLKVAVFSCNADHGFPDNEVVRHVGVHDPHMAFFLGDQFYEGSGGFGIQTDSVEEATLDVLHKWYMFGWSYRELFRHVPSACIPDDHDVYHGNVWGEGGKNAPTDEGWGAVAQDQGGYKMPAEWVNAVQRSQTSHLPDPYDPTPVEQGIGVYYTRWDYAGVSFAILEDRKFKSAPANVLPAEAQVLNGWIHNPDFDVREYRDLPEAQLLGDRQMAFLEDWAEDWSGPSYMKVLLSQTNFAAVHTIPEDATSGAVLPSLPMPEPGEYVRGDKLSVDMDSNGWPQDRRDEALRVLQRCSAFHIAGDQHLATIVRHGIDVFGDAGFSFTGPALNNIWPRRWWPPEVLRERPLEGGPAYTGDYFDGFGNRITVHASANPRATGLEPAIIRDRVTGYGIVTFDTAEGRIRMECWPRHADPTQGDSGQYEGWPLEIDRDTGDGRTPTGFLPMFRVQGAEHPVVEVRTADGQLVYARRMAASEFTLPVFSNDSHVVRVGDPDRGRWLEQTVTQEELEGTTMNFDLRGPGE